MTIAHNAPCERWILVNKPSRRKNGPMTSRENRPLQHPEWELVTDTEAEISLDALRDAFAGVFDAPADSPPASSSITPSSDSTAATISNTTESITSDENRTDMLADYASATTGDPQTTGHITTSHLVDPSDSVAAAIKSSSPTHDSHAPRSNVQSHVPPSATSAFSAASPPTPSEELDDEVAEQPEDSRCRLSPLSILEAMLFTGGPGGAPLTAVRASEPMRGVKPEDIPELVHQLNQKYLRSGRAFEIVPCGQGYQMKLRPQYASIRNLFSGKVREAKLSAAAVQVLSIVAWKQPITAEQVTGIRSGSPSQTLLSQLVRRRLLCVERPDGDRVAVYRTTERFLQLFHLQSLADLPQSDDF